MEVRKLPSNADADKAIEKKEETRVVNKPVISGKVRHRTSIGKLFKQTFIPEDVSNAKEYILVDLIMPAIKNGLFDTVMNIIDFWRGGGGSYRRPSNIGAPRPRVGQQYDYNRVSRVNSAPAARDVSQSSRYSYDDIVIDDYPSNQGGSSKARADAEAVLVSLQDVIDRYSVARISDLYDFVGLTGVPSDNDYGWASIDGATVRRVNGGWLLVLPKAMPID